MANVGDFFSAEIHSFIAAESVVQESEDELDAIMLQWVHTVNFYVGKR